MVNRNPIYAFRVLPNHPKSFWKGRYNLCAYSGDWIFTVVNNPTNRGSVGGHQSWSVSKWSLWALPAYYWIAQLLHYRFCNVIYVPIGKKILIKLHKMQNIFFRFHTCWSVAEVFLFPPQDGTIVFSLCIIVFNCTVQLWDPVCIRCAELCAIVAPACIMRHCTIVDIEHIC